MNVVNSAKESAALDAAGTLCWLYFERNWIQAHPCHSGLHVNRENPVNLYVGNLTFDATEESVRQAFVDFGDVTSVRIITDRETGRSRGFGFVEMADAEAARAAIAALDGTELDGRPLTVNEARPREQRAPQRASW